MATILIVDDRPANREFLVTLLGYSDHRLLEAGDGAEGLALVRAERPDLVIADVLMPTMDGYEFVRQLRAEPAIANTRVIFYTAHFHEPEARRLAVDCGVAAVLTKPSEPEVVLQTIETVLGNTPPPSRVPTVTEFDREHVRVMTDKLAQRAEELRRTNERLTALVELGLQLGSERDPVRLLHLFCDAARQIIGARYALVGISMTDGRYRHFMTSGMDAVTTARIGRPGPLIGVVADAIAAGDCFRALTPDGPVAIGAPASFPAAGAVLVAPVLSPARVYGWICLLDKVGADGFSEEDEQLVKMLAAQTGRIYENGSLYSDLLSRTSELAQEISERKRAEAEVRESEERFRSAFEHTGVATALTDLDSRFVRVNAAFAQTFGYAPHELPGMVMGDVMNPDDRAAIRAGCARLLAGEARSFQSALRYICRAGRHFWGTTNVSLVRGPDGRPVQFVSQVQDITEQKRAEAEVRRSADLLRAVADGTTDAVFVKDRDGKYLLFNEAAARFVGKPVAEVLGKDDTTLFDPASARVSMDNDRRVLASGLTETEEETLTAVGITRTYLATKGPYRDADGNVIGVIGISRDITDRKRAEQRVTAQHAVVSALAQAADLREAAPKLLEAVCETTGWDVGGLWIVDHQSRVLSCVDLWPAEEPDLAEFRGVSRGTTFAPGVGLPGRVWASGEPLWVVDVTRDPNFPRSDAAARADLHGGFGFPIRLGNEVLGVAEFFSRTSRRPDAELLRTFETLGSQIGQFIERKRAEGGLRLFRALIDRTIDGVEVIDPETGRFLDANEQAAVLHGYTRPEFLRLGVFDVDPVVARRPWKEGISARRASGENSFESLHRRKDGSTFPVEVNLSFIQLDREYLVAVVRDISERKHTEEALRAAQHRLEHVVSSSPSVLFALGVGADEIRGISWISGTVREMLGYEPSEAFERDWWTGNIHPEDRGRVISQTQADLFARGRASNEYRFRHGDGTYRWTRGEIRLTRNAAGEPIEAVGAWSDITERKLLEEQVQQSQKMEAVGRLAGGVAHDFNNLLTVINGYGEIALASLPDTDINRELIREMVKAGERATGLTRQLLAFSRKAIIEPKILDLTVVVTDVERMLRRIVGEDIQLTVAADPETGFVLADPGQIEQVILNLVVNARDAMPSGGRLTIELRNVELDESYTRTHSDARPGAYVLLAVTDSGSGMDAATMARIFEPFFSTKGEHGTGLGLATLHGIVKQSGGHVGVYSEVGQGTTFKVYLPRTEPGPIAPKSRMLQQLMPKGGETLLLVEDEDGVRALARHVLRGCGYTVLEARDGVEALRLTGEHRGRIHLLLTDVVMPRMNGRQLAERLMELVPGIQVLFLSGYTDDAVVRHGILEAEVAFLQKPFTPGSLAAKVREILDATT
ncbi:multi-sensor hybrid histidine kinase : Multi-sensor hybrid histidine kinase OS=Chthoniobacter flavus Ellin428 GN=CfE428DRAFT_6228 PE=4 SV=1: Response_reg: GAF_3: PAS_4: PAS_4: GAF_2: PAS_9: PAS_3: HisKA: HATPase_c: Response_reg [Gemmata massiliana]|uniref:histidine kinase n=1 Tax=Gemmata massiliana TaxID=1210884 RepID=A0A6P2D0N4_9BACT|nr:PAS domain S-box protein [Gemmata massiliana]VTR94811.1 multi-sensor hybrid histidine kinase : Multi-sensor hybrid histidine kinase OS=Chthoniobacter flavus Ellin428 GN=CfE428DRAFT_6228 PE=4 SV=1: Response_reg: GAF_3: PAS_4: PAS_4: GAF_2: PAS_9: PAS_3: HisKA: HATPase_c: Response_reg [Gemmata massiliana]